jgi:four helix bundle protein
MSSGVRELRVWQESVALAGDVVRAIRQGMRRETTCLSEAAMATALAIPIHVAEGYARATPPEQREAYLAARHALLRLDTELAVAKHADLLPSGAFAELTARAGQVSKLLGGFLAYLDRQLADAAARPPARAPFETAPNPGSAGVPS